MNPIHYAGTGTQSIKERVRETISNLFFYGIAAAVIILLIPHLRWLAIIFAVIYSLWIAFCGLFTVFTCVIAPITGFIVAKSEMPRRAELNTLVAGSIIRTSEVVVLIFMCWFIWHSLFPRG